MTTAILLLGTAGPAYAEVVPLGYKEFTGPRPYVYFSPDTLERAESFEVVVSADPAQDHARANAIATAARNKPARAGNFLKAQGYWCRRHELRGTASVRCTRGTNIIRISGKLRR